MKIFEHIKYGCALIVVYLAIGCNSWLDEVAKPENEQVSTDFWKTKEEVFGVLAGAYTEMRNCLPSFIQWGELRADAVQVGPSGLSDQDMMNIQKVNLRPDNLLVLWDKFYSVIGRCNSVIKYGPGVLKDDPTFKKVVCDAYLSEAYWIRSLMYFYLVRNFCEVPFITEPYITDDQDFNIPKSSDTLIINSVLKDLKTHAMKCPPSYVTNNHTRGRATRWAYYALIADMSLWAGYYEDAIKYSQMIIDNNSDYYLLDKSQWFQIYYPGNSPESIFDLQWDIQNQNNNLYSWTFNSMTSDQMYEVSGDVKLKFTQIPGEIDVRAEGGSYLDNGKLWKYAGKAIDIEGKMTRTGREKDINWPVYRLSDVMLIKAMALVFTSASNYQEATDIVNKIRSHRGYSTDLPAPSDEDAMIQMILDEREREFLGEGKRWYDLLCVARQDNYSRKDGLVEIMLQGVSIKDRELLKLRLKDPHGFYLPIHEDEIDNSEDVLIQNPYYQSVN